MEPLKPPYTLVGEDVGANVPVGAAEGALVGNPDVGAIVGTVDGAGEGPVGAELGGLVSPLPVGFDVWGDDVGDSEPVGTLVGALVGKALWRVHDCCSISL